MPYDPRTDSYFADVSVVVECCPRLRSTLPKQAARSARVVVMYRTLSARLMERTHHATIGTDGAAHDRFPFFRERASTVNPLNVRHMHPPLLAHDSHVVPVASPPALRLHFPLPPQPYPKGRSTEQKKILCDPDGRGDYIVFG